MIEGSHCRSCKRTFVPKRDRCPICHQESTSIQIPAFGRVLSHTTLLVPPDGVSGPLNILLVQLKGVKIISYAASPGAMKTGRYVIIEEKEGFNYARAAKLSEIIRRLPRYWR